MRLLIATHNPAKASEYKRYLSNLGLELVSLPDLNITEEAPEDGKTFEENAVKKVKFYQRLSNLPTIGDDGGLMIDALNGAPGVKSRRWFGYRMTDEEMIQSVIKRMKDVPEGKRACHLVGIVALVMPDGAVFTQWAQIDGEVARVPTEKRAEGFPYRSFFYIPQFKKFYLDLTNVEHEQINHRKIALLKLRPYLLELVKK
jgi:XTP/dITP diphosphohydrolase